MKQITSFNVLKAAVIRCSIEKSGEKMIDLRILLDIINTILTMQRIQKIDPSSMAKSNVEFSASQLAQKSTAPAPLEEPIEPGEDNMEGVHMISLGAVTEAVYGSQQKKKGGLDMESLNQIDERFRQAM